MTNRDETKLPRIGESTRSPGPLTDVPGGDESLEAQLAEFAERCARLDEARTVAEAGDRAKSCFLAAMSRELRLPVDGVSRMIELLRQTDLDEEQQRYVTTANHSVNALLSLLDSVLNLSTIDIGKLDLGNTDFNLRLMVEETVNKLTPMAEKKDLRIAWHVQPELPTLLRGEGGRLRQILLYTMGEAIRFANHGDLAVQIAAQRSTDTTTVVRFTVRHAETAIPPQRLERAFDLPALLDGTAETAGGTSRLALSIAKPLVELMGGQIGIVSDEGRGFEIWFTIPLDNFHQPSDDRRAHGRLPQELLQSNFGPVLDLSMGGMRIRCSRPPKGEVSVQLFDPEETVQLRAEVVRTQRLGFRKYEIGLSFLRVPPEVAKQLTRISLNHRLRRLLRAA